MKLDSRLVQYSAVRFKAKHFTYLINSANIDFGITVDGVIAGDEFDFIFARQLLLLVGRQHALVGSILNFFALLAHHY